MHSSWITSRYWYFIHTRCGDCTGTAHSSWIRWLQFFHTRCRCLFSQRILHELSTDMSSTLDVFLYTYNAFVLNYVDVDISSKIYCNGFDQRVARQQLCKHRPTRNSRWGCESYFVRTSASAGNGPMNSHSDSWHVFSVWSAPCNNRGAVFSVLGPCREDMREYGNGKLTWVPKFQGNSSVARRRIRRLSVWCYMCCSMSILGMCNLVRLL
jgi:hypothetical protein